MATAGKTSVGASEDFNAANDGAVNGPYAVGIGSTITEFHAYFRSDGNGPAIAVRPLIYEDNAGEPGALIATLAQIQLTTGDTTGAWRDLTGLSVVSPAANIWIGLWNLNSNYRYAYDTPGGTPERYKGVLATYSSSGDAPDPWPAASDSTSTQEPSMYVVYTAAGSGQVLAPSADSADGNWTNESGSQTNLYASIDETSASNTDYIMSELGPQTSACRVKLATGTDPASSTGHSIKWRAGKDAAGGQAVDMQVKLYQGGGNSLGAGTLIASFNRSGVSETLTDFTETLSGGEADSITNYADLYLEFSADT